jgi:hypothetical protein
MSEILGFKANTVYAIIIVMILVILGIVSFHYYAFVSAGKTSAFSAGAGAGFTLYPYKEHMTLGEYDACAKKEGYVKCLHLPKLF